MQAHYDQLVFTLLLQKLSFVLKAKQGIIDCTGLETFTKEHKLTELSSFVRSWGAVRKVHWFFSYVGNDKFADFGVLLRDNM